MKHLEKATLDFLNLRFGMFIHYNMSTYHEGEQWAEPIHDPKSFKPSGLDCSQWASAAKSAKMNYAVLTTKHHDGFSLWNTSVTDYDISSSGYDGDIVKAYVDAFRAEDIKIGFYFSVWDRHHHISHGQITPEKIDFMKTQLSELLTHYGEIICIVIDGWGSVWGDGPDFEELPFQVLADHIHSIQPNCLVINHSCKVDLSVTNLIHYEATHGQHCPYDNTYPSQQGPTLQPTWFWEPGYEDLALKTVDSTIRELNFCHTHTSNYLLNAAPNPQGLLDKNVVTRLEEIGRHWQVPQPLKQLPPLERPQKNVTVSASSTNGDPDALAAHVIECNIFTYWKAGDDDQEPFVELDYGRPETFNAVVINGDYDKTVQEFVIEALVENQWQELLRGGVMDFCFKGEFPDVTAQKYRIRVLKSQATPVIKEITLIYY